MLFRSAPGANFRCARPRRGGLVGKPRRAISRFRHQDAQPPPSPRVGEGGRGDEGAHAHGNARASLPGTLPLRGARASGAHTGGTPAPPTRRKPQVRAPSQGRVGWQAPAYHLPFQASGRPTSPFSQFGRREQGGDEGQKCGEDSGMLANRSSGYPARSHRRGAPSGDKCLQMPALIV